MGSEAIIMITGLSFMGLIGTLYINLRHNILKNERAQEEFVTRAEHDKDLKIVYKTLSEHKDFNRQNFDTIIALIKRRGKK